MKYLHPEKVSGVGLRPIDRIINLMATIPSHGDNNDNIDRVMEKLSKKDKETIRKMLESDKDGDGFTEQASHAMKAILDVKKENKVPVYSIGKEFFRNVKLLNRDITIGHVNLKDKHVYFTFDSMEFEGAYVTSDIWKENREGDNEEFMALRIALTPKIYGISNIKVFNFAIVGNSFNVSDLYHSKTGEELKNYAKVFDKTGKSVVVYAGNYERYRSLLTGIINSLIYINSQDPDIEALKPLRLYQKKELSSFDNSKKSQIRTIPVNLVSWSMYGKRYSVDQTVVSPHMRWQPCGPNRSQVKLVWVKEHIRKYQS